MIAPMTTPPGCREVTASARMVGADGRRLCDAQALLLADRDAFQRPAPQAALRRPADPRLRAALWRARLPRPGRPADAADRALEVRRDACCGCAPLGRLAGTPVDGAAEAGGLHHHHYPCQATMGMTRSTAIRCARLRQHHEGRAQRGAGRALAGALHPPGGVPGRAVRPGQITRDAPAGASLSVMLGDLARVTRPGVRLARGQA